MVANSMADRPTSSASTLYGIGVDVNSMVQGAYPVDPAKQFAWSANARLQPEFSSFDSTAASLGLSTEQALRLMASSSSASIIDSNGPTSAVAYPVPTPYVPAVEIPGGPPLKSIPVLTETDGGFWRGLAGDRRSVFETPAPLSEKIGAGVRAVGEFIADPLIELGNQYRDVHSAASGATGGWRSAFAQQVSDGSYGGAALTELGMAAGAAPMAGAALKGLAWAVPAAGPMIDAYAARTGMLSYVVDNGGVSGSGISASGGQFVVAPTREAVGALKDFGLDATQRRAFFEGKQVIFEDPATIYQTATIFQLESNTLRAGIWDVVSDGSGAILSFANRSRALGSTLGVRQLELFGADLQNDALANILVRRGFTPGEPVLINSFGFNKYVPTLRRLEDLQK